MKPILEVQNLSKEFIIGANNERYLALRDILSNPLKFINNSPKEVFKALDDLSFNVMPGESIGIIGRNGAGKSTLLKILSKITPPTSGKIICRGRIAALLEVGTGFHPELSGRENVYMNGSILGMRKWEIDKHFDEIVEFSGVEKFLNTPLKQYSSGMQLRLAFAVAAHLEPEILIIDEVLAVGDAEFQKKCLGKMDEVSKSGRTVLFVSHDLNAVTTLTKKSILLKNGKLINCDFTPKIIKEYNTSIDSNDVKIYDYKKTYLSDFYVNSKDKNFAICNEKNIFYIEVTSQVELDYIYIGIGINDKLGRRLFTPYSKHYNKKYKLNLGKNIFQCEIENLMLKPETYGIEIYVGDGYQTVDYYNDQLNLNVISSTSINPISIPDDSQGYILKEQIWN